MSTSAMPANDLSPRWLILVKHAKPVLDPELPARDWQLSPEGQASCRLLADWLQAYAPHRIVTSQEPKAVETGRLAAQQLAVPCTSYPGLQEHERPQPGLASLDMFQASVSQLFARPTEVVFGSESADQAHSRFSAAVGRLIETWGKQPGALVVVAHGTVISLYVSRRCGLEPFPLWRSLGLPSAVVLRMDDAGRLSGNSPLIKELF